jgi:hypothetical protein
MRRLPLTLFLTIAVVLFTGCAAVFRDSRPRVHFESDPQGADTRINDMQQQPTPVDVEIERSGSTSVVMRKAGYQDHRATVKKKLNPGWLTVDILDCVIPVALCIPLLVDAISGAWYDVPKSYMAKLEPGQGTPPINPVLPTAPAGTAPPPVASATPAIPQMSESERKAAARAAYMEGLTLQEEKKDCAAALPRFETAQKLFDAPTHLLHIAQCQAQTGRLVESQETYETLSRLSLAATAPEPFKQAVEQAKKELPGVKARVPTLRVQVTPAPSSIPGLVVQLNGTTMPNELVGIARPINPGRYRVTCTAPGWKQVAPTDIVTVDEGTQKTADVKMSK